MFGMAQSLDDVTYSSLTNALGEEGLDRALDEADALAFVDWTMVPGFTGILRGIHECILPRISPKDRLFFFDLADPTKRDSNELRTTLEIIALYSRFGRVNLGLNRKEARQVLAVLGRGARSESARLEEFAIEIRKRLAIEAVVDTPGTERLAPRRAEHPAKSKCRFASSHAFSQVLAITSMRVIFLEETPDYCPRKRSVQVRSLLQLTLPTVSRPTPTASHLTFRSHHH